MAIPIVNSRDLPNTWRILDDKIGGYRERGLPFRYPYVGAFSQSLSEWFIRTYSNPGDTVFDPFCVAKDSKVLLNQQDKIKMQDICEESDRKIGQTDTFGNFIKNYNRYVTSIDLECFDGMNSRNSIIKSSPIQETFTRDSKDIDVYEITTRNRRILKASGDHTFLIKNGKSFEWKRLKNIKFGDMVAIYPSIISCEDSIDDEIVILNEKNIIDNIPEGAMVDHILNELSSKGLLPLTNKNKKLFVMARLLGLVMTDGYMCDYYTKDGYLSTNVAFYSGEQGSLLDIAHDIKFLGFEIDVNPLKLKEKVGPSIDRGLCSQIVIGSRTLYVLLKALGAPIGEKHIQTFDIPKWIYNCSKRVKQEFLGGLMGGDGIIPSFSYRNNKSKSPILNGGGFLQSKIVELENHLREYMKNIMELIEEFGIDCNKEYRIEYELREDNKKSVTYRINFKDSHRNVLNFLRYIGYRYDSYKLRDTYQLYEYLISKENRIGIDSKKTNKPFPSFGKWKDMYTLEDVIFDETIIVKKVEYKDKLYDLSIKGTHNYVVNEFITHNSGRGTTAMQSLFHDRNMICNDLSAYSNVLCHSILYPPYTRDAIEYLKIMEDYINSDSCKISTSYAGKGSTDDVAKLYNERTFDQIIKLRNLLNYKSILLGRGYNNHQLGEKVFITDINKDAPEGSKSIIEKQREYDHEIVMFLRMVMSQLMLNSSEEVSFNGIKTRGTDNTNIRALLRFYDSINESPKKVDIFENMKYYIEKMGLDNLGIRDRFYKLNRKMISCDARKLDLPDKCADMVLTSPPYYANLNYGMANWLRIWSVGGIGDPLVGGHINADVMEKQNNSEVYGKTYDKITDSAGGTVDNPMSYSSFSGQYLRELYRILKDDGVAIIVVGDYGNKKKIQAWRVVTDRAEIFGFKPQMVIMDELNKQVKSSTQFQMKHDGGKNDFDVCVVLHKGNYQRKNDPENIDFRWNRRFVDSRQKSIDEAWG